MTQEYNFNGENISQFAKLSINSEQEKEKEKENVEKKDSGIESKINTELLDLDENLKQRVISLRSIVTTKEAGAIIGKGGKNVKEVRETTNVKAGISKVVEDVKERILTVTGTLDNVAKAYSLFAGYLIDNNNLQNINSNKYHNRNSNKIAIHLLVSHLLLGSVIGKSGENIKEIQKLSSAYIAASKEMLPQSTERVIEIIGTVDSIHIAVYHIIVSILKDIERSTNMILFQPSEKYDITDYLNISLQNTNQNRANNNTNNNNTTNNNNNERRNSKTKQNNTNDASKNDSTKLFTVNFPVPSKLVGCTIGKKGSKIDEIRRVSGSKISISPASDSADDNRIFTLTGTKASNDKALSIIYDLLKAETERFAEDQQQKQ